jgi:hypothetical protein
MAHSLASLVLLLGGDLQGTPNSVTPPHTSYRWLTTIQSAKLLRTAKFQGPVHIAQSTKIEELHVLAHHILLLKSIMPCHTCILLPPTKATSAWHRFMEVRACLVQMSSIGILEDLIPYDYLL